MRSTRKRFQLLIYREAGEKRSFLFAGRLRSPIFFLSHSLSLSLFLYPSRKRISNANKLSRYTGSRGETLEIETPRFSRYTASADTVRNPNGYVLITRRTRETSLRGNEIWQENHDTWIVVNPIRSIFDRS